MDRLVDEYGNMISDATGKRVACKLAEFYVASVRQKGLDWWLVMDKTKPYKILDETDPMRVCVEQGNFTVQAAQCWEARGDGRLTDECLREMIEDLERDCNPGNDDIFDALVELHAYRAAAPLEKVQEREKAFEEGRAVVLPCKVGDTVYVIDECYCGLCDGRHNRIIERSFYHQNIGKPVFLSREEAQAALDAQKGTGHG